MKLCIIPQFTDRCNFHTPLGGETSNIGDKPALSTILGTTIINIGMSGSRITASLAIQVDDLSIVVVAYSRSSITSHFVGFVSYLLFLPSFLPPSLSPSLPLTHHLFLHSSPFPSSRLSFIQSFSL